MSYKIFFKKFTKKTIFYFISHPIFLNFQKITLNSSRIRRCIICALILGYSYRKRVKRTKNPVADDKNCKILSRHVQEPTTLNSNQNTWFTTKPNPLSLTQSENYFFGASFDKISSNDKNLPIQIFKFFRGLKTPPNKFVG